jgi:hypothetical protein
MNPFEIPPSSDGKDPKDRKQWGVQKKPLTPLDPEELESLGIKKNWKAEKYNNFEADSPGRNDELMITDNIVCNVDYTHSDDLSDA